MADERVTAVVDGQVAKAVSSQAATRRTEPFAKNMAAQGVTRAARLQRTDHGVAILAAVTPIFRDPRGDVVERPFVPLKRNLAPTAALGDRGADHEVRLGNADAHVAQAQAADLGEPKPTTAGEPKGTRFMRALIERAALRCRSANTAAISRLVRIFVASIRRSGVKSMFVAPNVDGSSSDSNLSVRSTSSETGPNSYELGPHS